MMKKTVILLLAIFMMVFVGSTNVNAEEQKQQQGYISVEATSQMEILPDVVDFSVEVVTTSKESMANAVEENKKTCAKVYDGLKKYTDKNSSDSIKTSNYSANPVYRYNGNKRVLDYYQVRNSIKIHTKDVANVGKMIDTATTNGATSVNNISYAVSSYDNESNKLLADTAQKAKQQGENIAKAMGAEIVGIRSISSSCSFTSRSSMPRMVLMSKSLGAANDSATEESSTNIELGTMTLHARVNADFYVK